MNIMVFYLTSFRYVLNILKILTVYYFTQNHTYTAYVVIKLADYLIRKEGNIRFFSIVLFVFQFLGLLIYLEIIELNFLRLNKNTKKNIEKREEEDNRLLSTEEIRISEVEEDGKIMNKVEISPGYIIESEMQDLSRNTRNIRDSKIDDNNSCIMNEKMSINNIDSQKD